MTSWIEPASPMPTVERLQGPPWNMTYERAVDARRRIDAVIECLHLGHEQRRLRRQPQRHRVREPPADIEEQLVLPLLDIVRDPGDRRYGWRMSHEPPDPSARREHPGQESHFVASASWRS